jgi:hypothetical protein
MDCQRSRAGLPDFSWYQNGGIYTNCQMPIKYIKWPSQIYPNWYFWFENIPSGPASKKTAWFLAAWSSGIVSACHRGDLRVPPGYRMVV